MTPSSPARAQTSRLRRAQLTALALLVLTGTLNYLDRSALSVANPYVRDELGLSLGAMGVLLSAFSWSYAFAQLPIGGLIDRYRPRAVLAVGILLWSAAQAACGLVRGFGSFVVARVALGIGESPQYPTAARVVSDWFPRERRGVPTGIFNAASPLGTAIAPPLLSVILVAWGWRAMFIVLGLAGILVAAIWWQLYRNPGDVALDADERRVIADPAADDAPARPAFAEWRALFRHATTWGMILGFFGSVYLNWLYLTWLPSYLQIERGMDTIRSGFAAFVPFFCGFIGCLTAGWLSDWLVRRTGSLLLGRKYLVVRGDAGDGRLHPPCRVRRQQRRRARLHLGRRVPRQRRQRRLVGAGVRGPRRRDRWHRWARCRISAASSVGRWRRSSPGSSWMRRAASCLPS